MNKNNLFIFLILLAACFLAYGSTLKAGFIWDDKTLIVENKLAAGPRAVQSAFQTELYEGTRANYYRPLTALSFVLNRFVGRLDPFGYHLINILLHLLAGWLAYLFILKLTGRYFLSFAASLVFLVHPVAGQVVSYISGRADALALIFIFSCLLIYLKAGLRPYLASLGLFVFGLLTKEIVVVLPLVVAALEICQNGLRGSRWKRALGYLLVGAVYISLRLTVWNFASGNPFLAKKGFAVFEVGFFERLGLFVKTLLIYLGSFFVPAHLHMERLIAHEAVHPVYWLGVVFFAAVACLFYISVRRSARPLRRAALFFVFWFFVWLLPQSAFVFPRIMAEHFLYLSSFALCFVLGFLMDQFPGKILKGACVAAVAIYFTLFSWRNNATWTNELSFFEHTVRYAPASIRAADSLAALYLEAGRYEEAEREFRRILDLSESLPQRSQKDEVKAAVFYNLGLVLERTAREEDALFLYKVALGFDPKMPEACNNAGLLYQKMGQRDLAEDFFKRSIEHEPQYYQAYNNLAQLYAQEGDYEKATGLWMQALTIHPGYEVARKNLEIVRELWVLEKRK